jgi:23S rRNA (adenine2503-C2)-methyltransferase
MPVEATYPLDELREAIAAYQRSRRRNRFAVLEYVAIPGENMGAEDVAALGDFVRGIPCIVNVIPYNAVGDRFRAPTWREVRDFTNALRTLRVPVKVRYSGGKRVAAGCGQLAADLVATAAPTGHMVAPPGVFSDL